MITNLLATLTTFLATNTVEVVTRYEYYDSPPLLQWNGAVPAIHPVIVEVPTVDDWGNRQWPRGRGRNPLAKTLTTTTTRIHRLTYEWAGAMHTNEVVEVVDRVSKHYQLERAEKWVVTEGTLTHFPVWTNNIIIAK